MRVSLSFVCAALLSVLLPGGVALRAEAQTFSAIRGIAPVFAGDFTDRAPGALPPHHEKTAAPLMYARIRDGVYSIDGLVGKVRLNYDVKAAGYLYLFMPGVGTALVSVAPSADAVSVPAAYDDGQLTVHIADHTINVTGIQSLVTDDGKEPAVLFVSLDRSAWKLSRTPMLGYGSSVEAPYQWPGTLPVARPAMVGTEEAPVRVPASLLPRPLAYSPQSGTR